MKRLWSGCLVLPLVIAPAGATAEDIGGAYNCRADSISDCSAAGCTPLAMTGMLDVDLTARTFRLCIDDVCRDGALEAYFGKLSPSDKGMAGLRDAADANGFGASIDFDRGRFTLLDGTRAWNGPCVEKP